MQTALSIEQALAATGLGRTKLYEAINSGKLRARKLGKRTLILQSELELFLAGLEEYRPVTTLKKGVQS